MKQEIDEEVNREIDYDLLMILLMKRIRESQRDEENKLQIDRVAAMVVKRFSSRQVSQQPLESYLSFLAVPHIATVHCPEVRRDMT